LSDSALPSIVLVLADNLGWGELGCYGGGLLRGAPTPRIDRLASEGLRFLNFNVESDCVPTRSALMTGRHPVRTGAIQSIPAGLPQGIIPWEITLAQLLSGRGYATAIFGKWHLGDKEGRYPKDRGFDEWYGIPRTTNESLFASTAGFDPSVVKLPCVMEGRAGKPAREVEPYDLDMRRRIDVELTRRTIDFMRRQVKAGRPFFAYVPLTQLHYPTLPHADFKGRTGAGDFADSMAEMDHRVGQILDEMDALGVARDAVMLFGSDNGPEFRRPWRGTDRGRPVRPAWPSRYAPPSRTDGSWSRPTRRRRSSWAASGYRFVRCSSRSTTDTPTWPIAGSRSSATWGPERWSSSSQGRSEAGPTGVTNRARTRAPCSTWIGSARCRRRATWSSAYTEGRTRP